MKGRIVMKTSLVLAMAVIVSLIASLIAACAPAPRATPAPASPAAPEKPEVIKWTAASCFPATFPHYKFGVRVFKRVEEMSNGRLKVDCYPSGALMSGFEVFEACDMGTIDAAISTPAYWSGYYSAAPLFATFPLGFDPLEFYGWYYYWGGNELYHEMYSDRNFGFQHICGACTPENLAWSHKPIRTLDDFKGLKFRTIALWGEILSSLGCSVTPLPADEVYPALERKVIDAAEWGSPFIDKTLGFHEICEYMTVPGIHQPCGLTEILINKDSWNKLPDDIKAMIKYAAETSYWDQWFTLMKKDIEALKFFQDYGVKIIKFDPASIEKLIELREKVFAKHAAKDPFFAKVLESQQKFLREFYSYYDWMYPPELVEAMRKAKKAEAEKALAE